MSAEQQEKRGTKAEATSDARLIAARKRLAESAGEDDAVEGLREIVANLLGSEEIGLFKLDRETKSFRVCWSFGVDLYRYDLPRALGEGGLHRVMRGECYIDFSDRARIGDGTAAQAFVPLRAGNQTIAILAILRLLPQKLTFDGSDMALFKLLSEEAAKPLFGASLHFKTSTEEPGLSL